MDPNSSIGKFCLGENDVIVILSEKVKGSGDWSSPEFQDTANSGQKKETKAMVFYQIEIEEVGDRFMAPCYVNGLKAYDGEINLGVEENMISNEYAVKLCLEYEVKRGNKVVKRELILALGGKIYFVKFINNPEEDDVEHGKLKKKKREMMIGTNLLDFNIDDIPLLGKEELLSFVCKMGKSSCNKKRTMENLNFFYQDIGTSSSAGEEERPIIETMAYHDKYKKILDEVWKDNVDLDGKIVKEEEAVKRIKGEALKEKDDPRHSYLPSDQRDRSYMDTKKVLCQMRVTTLIAKFLILDISINCDSPIVVGRGILRTIGGILNTLKRLFSTFDRFCHQTFCAARSDVMRNTESDSDDEEDYHIKRNRFGAPIYGPKPAPYLNCNDPVERSLAIQTVTNPFLKISIWKKAVSFLGSLPVPLKKLIGSLIIRVVTLKKKKRQGNGEPR
nr:hypothetical protein [Tanacetum cinerariifolium]